jgi:uncharacterized protein YifE (UPF0438 family)
MATPADHLTYLRQQGYTARHSADLSQEEAALLARFGHWMEALASGWIKATTPEQSHFVAVAHGDAEPLTPFEQVWRKVTARPTAAAEPPAEPVADAPDEPLPVAEASLPKLDQLAEVRRYVEDIRLRKEAERAAVLRTVQAQLEAIDTRYAQQLEEAEQALAELEAEVKAAVVQLGKSVRAGPVQAVFYRGSVTWDSRALAEYAQANPQIEQFRKIGAPRVVIRYR